MLKLGYGIELVWDVWNEQFSAFTYPLKATAYPTLALGVGICAGAGFGMHDHVHKAWSGQFTVWEGSIESSVWKFLSLEGGSVISTAPKTRPSEASSG